MAVRFAMGFCRAVRGTECGGGRKPGRSIIGEVRKHEPESTGTGERQTAGGYRPAKPRKVHYPLLLIVSLARDCARDAYGHKTPI